MAPDRTPGLAPSPRSGLNLPAMERHLSPSETARRFGITIKALRLYEQRGLLKPVRSACGATGSPWRAYGPDQIVRLHQILALKRLGLSLARIGQILNDSDQLDSVLALQESALARDSARVARALSLVKAARLKLAAGRRLSIDDLADLTKETGPAAKSEEVSRLFASISARHFTPEESAMLQQRKCEQPEVGAAWEALTQEAGVLMLDNDPTSPAAQDLARRWRALSDRFTGGDPKIQAKVRAVWTEALSDPEIAGKLPVRCETFHFMDLAVAHLTRSEAAAA